MNAYKQIIGADECGTGSLISFAVVCAVRAPKDWYIPGLNDSKQLTDKQRRDTNDILMKLAEDGTISYALAQVSQIDIENLGLYNALRSGYSMVIGKLDNGQSHAIIDGNINFYNWLSDISYETMVKADTKIPHVMAASIIGKVYRDTEIIKLADEYPQYGWQTNVGYYCKPHIEAIKKFGKTPYHRKTYKIKELGEK